MVRYRYRPNREHDIVRRDTWDRYNIWVSSISRDTKVGQDNLSTPRGKNNTNNREYIERRNQGMVGHTF